MDLDENFFLLPLKLYHPAQTKVVPITVKVRLWAYKNLVYTVLISFVFLRLCIKVEIINEPL